MKLFHLVFVIKFYISFVSSVSNENFYRLPNNTLPYHYDMDLEVILEPKFIFRGNITIELITLADTNSIVLHAEDLEFDKSNSYLLDKRNNKVHYFRISPINKLNDFLTLKFDKIIPEGIYTLHFSYQGNISDSQMGLYRTPYKVDGNVTRWIASTQFEPNSARRMFPCFDEPQLKATFELRVVHPSDRTAISNTAVSNTFRAYNRKMTSFKRTPLMSTYLLALAVTDYDHVETVYNNKKIRLYVEPKKINNTMYAQDVTIKALGHLEKILGVEYSLKKLDQIVVPTFPGGMENWGMIVYGKSIIHNPNKTSDREEENTLNLVSHELAHQWFGNLVTMKWWSFTWLNEGFATYYGHVISDIIEPHRRMIDKHVVSEVRRVMVADSKLSEAKSLNHHVDSKSEINSKFDQFSYTKGSAIIRFMASTFENFNISITKYLKDNAYASTTPEHLFKAFQDTNSFPPNADAFDILSTWTYQPGYPLITFNIDYDNNSATVSQKRFVIKTTETLAECSEKWWIPLTMSTEANPDFNNLNPIDWIRAEDDSIVIKLNDTDGWTILNNKQMVYGRVNYDDTNWRRIIDVLNSTDYKTIHYLNRAQLIDDSLNLARAGEISYETALNLTTYMHREQDPAPWYAAYPSFGFLNNVLSGTEVFKTFTTYVRFLIDAASKQSQLRSMEKKMKLERDFVEEFSKKFSKFKSKNWKGKQKQLTKTFSLLSDNIFTKHEYEKVEKLFATKIDTMDEMEAEMSAMTLKRIIDNIEYKSMWIELYYKDFESWFAKYFTKQI